MKKAIFPVILLIISTVFGQNPVNPNASKEAKDLLNYIQNLNGKILAGQHSFNKEPERFYNDAKTLSGKYPAVWGTDFYWNNAEDPGDRIVQAAIKKHEEGAIVTIMWHVGRPSEQPPYAWKTSVQNTLTDKQWQELTTPGTVLNNSWLAQVDNVASHLKKLQDAKIPVLWRPYHEMNGVWFWWGNKPGKNGYIKLWKMLYERLTDYHKLNNLIWVWNANAPRDIPQDEAFDYKDFYPGNKYVDILATDVYHYDYEQKDYDQLIKLADGKPIALGEVGELPKPEILKVQPKWSWFMVWTNFLNQANSPERVKAIYDYDQTITRDEIKR